MSDVARCPDPAAMRDLLAGQITPDQEAALLLHLDSCEACQQSIEAIATENIAWQARVIRLQEKRPAEGTALRSAMERLKHDSRTDSSMSGSANADELTLDFLEPAESSGLIGKLGQYEVTEIIGRGGMGVVLKALDAPLNRFVAIKVLAPQLATSAAARKRFAREAQAAAAVSHEHVVAIHGVSEVRGLPYIVMAYVPGRSLQERIDQAGPLELVPILRIGMQTAAGLAAAHAQGLIHRDVKPANILLEDDVDRVKITDFGLARAADDASLTQSGVVAGTPEYMSPEQASGNPVDHRSDLFSLGSLLYAMCTGRPPFRAESAMAVLRRVCDDRAHPVSELNSALPDWLVGIIDKLHCKNVAGRYQSAGEVAELLGQCLAHVQQPRAVPLPSTARDLARARALERTAPRRGSWRVAAAALLLMLGALGATEASGVTKLSELLGQVVRITTPRGTLVIQVDDPSVHVTVDGETVTIDGTGIGQLTLRAGSHHVQATKDGSLVHSQPIAISRGGRQVVKLTFEPTNQPLAQQPVEESPAGERPGPSGGTLHSTGTGFAASGARCPELPIFPLATHHDLGSRVAFSPNSQLLVATSDVVVSVMRLETRSIMGSLTDSGLGAFTAIAVSTGGIVGAGSQDGSIRLWDLESGQLRTRLQRHSMAISGLSFSPDGKRLASASADRTVKLWDLTVPVDPGREVMGTAAPTEQTTLWHASNVSSVQFSPDGQYVATADADGLLRLFDATTGKRTHSVQAARVTVDSLAISPDGKLVATAARDNSIQLWDFGAPAKARSIGEASSKQGGSQVPARADEDSSIAARKDRAIPVLAGATLSLAFSPDGKYLVSGGSDGLVKIWDVATGELLATLTGMGSTVRSVAISPDGRTIAAANANRKIVLYGRPEGDLTSGELIKQFKLAKPFFQFVDFGGHLRTEPEILQPTDCQGWADRGRVAFYATDEFGNFIERKKDDKQIHEEVVREQRWVVVTALFPHDEQRTRYLKATHNRNEEPDYAMLRVERRERQDDGSYSDWASIDFVRLAKMFRLLVPRWQTERAELRDANAVFRGLTMQLPELVEGEWLHVDRDEALDAARKTLHKKTAESAAPPQNDFEAFEEAMNTLFYAPRRAAAQGSEAPGSGYRSMAAGMMAGQALPPGQEGGRGSMTTGNIAGLGGLGSMAAPTKKSQQRNVQQPPPCTAERVLVRFIDFTVEPERIYQYRLKVVVRNPNHNRLDVVDAELTKKTILESSEWSEPTADVRVPADSEPSPALDAKASFFGIEASGVKIVYCIDRSGSMIHRDALSFVKRELSSSIKRLPANAQFQIIFYNVRPELLRPAQAVRRLLPATVENRQLAEQSVASVTPDGGTEHLPALRMALELGPDVVFFLTDADDIQQRDLEEIMAANKDRARVHAIRFGLGSEIEPTNRLRELAASSGGVYRYVNTGEIAKE